MCILVIHAFYSPLVKEASLVLHVEFVSAVNCKFWERFVYVDV